MSYDRCRLCDAADFLPSIDFGDLPIAHRPLRTPGDAEERFPFALHTCKTCGLLQHLNPIDADILYAGFNYGVSSWKIEKHLDAEIDSILAACAPRSAIDVGCNDGRFMVELRNRGVASVMGLEPNPAHAAEARSKGFEVAECLATVENCTAVVERSGRFDLVTTRQVVEHIPDLAAFFGGLRTLLADDGYLFVDVPDVATAIASGDCTVLWEEHVNYFQQQTLELLLRSQGFIPEVVRKYNFSGGTLAILARKAAHREHAVKTALSADTVAELLGYGPRVEQYGARLRNALGKAKAVGVQTVLYGAGQRACMGVNGLQLAPFLSCVVDEQRERQGQYLPGSGAKDCALEIVAPAAVGAGNERLICLLAVNNENDDAVKARFSASTQRPVQFVTLCSPGDIHGDLEKLEALLATVDVAVA